MRDVRVPVLYEQFEIMGIHFRSLLVLAGAQAMKRQDTIITEQDVLFAFHKLNKNNKKLKLKRIDYEPSNNEIKCLYDAMVLSFGPGFNMTKNAFGYVRRIATL